MRLPLTKSAAIVHGNALRIDWNEVVPAAELDYILGNPPFIGSKMMTEQQRADLLAVAGSLKGAGILDFVSAWYLKAAEYLQLRHPREGGDSVSSVRKAIRCAFVSTNSITQGEQVGVLWGQMLARGMKIFFAHRTFQWNNEARGVAAVHCVIVGFSSGDAGPKRLFDYDDIRGEPHQLSATNINPYLVDAADVLLSNRKSPISSVPAISFGSMPNDDGNLLLTDHERSELLAREPDAEPYIRRMVGSVEFLNGILRWCLWLDGVPPDVVRSMPAVVERVRRVRNARLASGREATRKLGSVPYRFGEVRQPVGTYIGIPKTSSERRNFIPIGLMDASVVAGSELFTVFPATLLALGIISSTMHMAWVRTVCGRLKSDYRYSAGIVYNNFPWPDITEEKHHAAIESAAQGVLDARAQFADSTLADLYDPLTMPPALVKAHQQLDRAVDAAYLAAEKVAGRKAPKLDTDAERVAFLFERYQQLVSILPADKPGKAARRPRRSS
ncbi:type IIL restriction-modification enzyme MmeI [Luteimonas yindakuii]|uniref:type IIL restriction-modification enzyme MmeI n=1 Tax=Luteimonas yindakuii TaxID=2565782 RepID=UPI001ABDE37E|nr:type IIL restriction-modification enzyme MmeI [Luteimonas yindakuii]